jgi:hypothetical protein
MIKVPFYFKSMRKPILLFIIFLFFQDISYAQVKIGLKFSPTFVFSRVNDLPDSISVASKKVGLRPQVGVYIDAMMTENYDFSTGIWYISKPVNYVLEGQNTIENGKQDYHLQYVQIPFTLKLYTNEVSIDKKIYAQIGSLAQVLIHHDNKPESAIVESFSPIDLSLYFGMGMNFRLSLNTMFEVGMSYSRGFVNIVKKDNLPGKFMLKNDMLSVDFSLIF